MTNASTLLARRKMRDDDIAYIVDRIASHPGRVTWKEVEEFSAERIRDGLTRQALSANAEIHRAYIAQKNASGVVKPGNSRDQRIVDLTCKCHQLESELTTLRLQLSHVLIVAQTHKISPEKLTAPLGPPERADWRQAETERLRRQAQRRKQNQEERKRKKIGASR